MAQKRMFDKRITDSDRFTDLPNSSKALYFMAGMSADDRGFFQPRRLQKMNGFTEDDFKVLIAKRYIIPFESGVMVITDWNKNNYLDKNRITETEYIDELKLLRLINDSYERLTDVKQPLNQYSIVENSIDNIKKEIYKERKFTKPTIEEIQKYCEERNNGINANAFYDFYESKNWYVGKNKMKDWKACVRTWEQRQPKKVIPEWFDKEIEINEAEEDTEFKNFIEGFRNEKVS